jgi:uncharacterized protein (DUF885 family)
MDRTFRTAKLIVLSFALFSCGHNYTKKEIENESNRLNNFFEEAFNESMMRSPTWQTYVGLKTNYDKLDNETEEFEIEGIEILKANLKKLESFNYDALNKQSRLSYDLFKKSLMQRLEGYEKWKFHHFPLNQMFGYHSGTPSFLINMHKIESKEDALAYISRLKEIKRVFQERMVYNKKQKELGIFAPKFTYDHIIDASRNIITGRPFTKSNDDSPLLKDFKQKIKSLKISTKEKNELIAQSKYALIESVKPAYDELISWIKSLDKINNKNEGAWSLPDGDEFYRFRLKSITTTDMTPEEIHEFGLKDVKRIHKEMNIIKNKVGFKGSLPEFFNFMKNSDRFYYPNTKSGKNSYLKDSENVIKEMKDFLPNIFNTFPKADLIVKAVEEYREKTAGTAFYQGPPLFGGRPGIYYVNLYKMQDAPKYELEALAYHEAIPGHHMQTAIMTELKDLPKFRRTYRVTSYTEGWGLYAERLAKDVGFYKDPYSDFRRLSMELWRASRLVVDTGIHSKKWSREKAINFLAENNPTGELENKKGIERYFIMPGQATAYKIGMEKILDLRERSKAKLGEKFDIREFHDVILSNGSLPLDILEDQVQQWEEMTLKS